MRISREELEQAIASEAGVHTVIEENGDQVIITGMAATEGERQAALEIAARFLDAGIDLVDNIEVSAVLPEMLAGLDLAVGDAGGFPGAAGALEDREAIEAVDFMDQDLLDNPLNAAGPTGAAADTEIGEGEEVWIPPTDPPSDGADEVIGGFQTTSMDENEEEPQSAVLTGPPDEALREAVLRELREDSQTTALEIDVEVFEGIATLRGEVDDMLDVEAVEAVAARVEGIVQVEERLRVRRQ